MNSARLLTVFGFLTALASCDPADPVANASFPTRLAGGGLAGSNQQLPPQAPGPFSVVLINNTPHNSPQSVIVTEFHMLGPDSQTDLEFLNLRPFDPQWTSNDDGYSHFSVPGLQQPGDRWQIRWTSNTHPGGGIRYVQQIAGPGTVYFIWEEPGWLGERGVPRMLCSAQQCID
jgi:hypothetical protein